MKTQIFYFSGTGNSLAVAKDLARLLPAPNQPPVAVDDAVIVRQREIHHRTNFDLSIDDHRALLNLVQSILTAGIILAAYFTHGDIWLVVAAYLAGKMLLNFGTVWLAWRSTRLGGAENR